MSKMKAVWMLCAFGLSMNLWASAEQSVGSGCRFDSDCGAKGRCIQSITESGETGFLGGYCTYFDCSAGDVCGAESSCVSIDSGPGSFTLCLHRCENDEGCRPGYECTDNGVCLPGCSVSCPTGTVCDEQNICVDD